MCLVRRRRAHDEGRPGHSSADTTKDGIASDAAALNRLLQHGTEQLFKDADMSAGQSEPVALASAMMDSSPDDSMSVVSHKPSGSKEDAHAMFSRKMRLGFREMKFQLTKRYPSGELTPAQLNSVLQRFDISINHQHLMTRLLCNLMICHNRGHAYTRRFRCRSRSAWS